MKAIKLNIKNIRSQLANLSKPVWSIIVFSVIALVIVLIFTSGDVSTYPVGWEKSYPITPYKLSAKNIKIDHKGEYITAVYEGVRNKKKGIYVSISFDGGNKFFKPIKIAKTESDIDVNPDIAISNRGHIAVVWQSIGKNDPNSRIFYSISSDLGATWPKPQRIKLGTDMPMLPRVVYDEKGILHLFYSALKGRTFNLFHTFSSEEKTFSPSEGIINVSGLRGAFFPSIYISKDNIYVVWQGKGEKGGILSDDLYFLYSDDYGESWSSQKQITFSRAQDGSPYIFLYKQVLYLVYQNNEGGNWSIKMLKGYENGDRWDKEPLTISTTNADCFSPVLVDSDDEKLNIIWYDLREKKPSIYSRKYLTNNRKLEKEQRLSKRNIISKKPVAVSMGKKVIVLWEEKNRIKAKSSDVHTDPPVVSSKTHPKDTWSRLSRARIKWQPPKDESKIAGYATMFKKASDYKLPDFTPTVQNTDGRIKETIITELEDGRSYFYMRAIDGEGNYSRTVRYKILVSTNPPPMPIIASPTHPELESVESYSPQFVWSIDNKVRPRLKGFLYAISKDRLNTPHKFTTKYISEFHDLTLGRYFFILKAVDFTNTFSRTATYEIIIGEAKDIDYIRIARDIDRVKKVKKKRLPKKRPVVVLYMPFDTEEAFYESSFNARVSTKYLRKRRIVGYSVIIDKEKSEPNNRINNKDGKIQARYLETGEYFIAAKSMYYKLVKGKKVYVWSDPVYMKFTISVPQQRSPLLSYMDLMFKRVNQSIIAVSICLMCTILSVVTIGFSNRFTFYARLLQLKFVKMIKG